MANTRNSNPYDNLAMIREVLRRYASPEAPMTANQVHQKMKVLRESPPSRQTVNAILTHHSDVFTSLFSQGVLPSQSAVQKNLRQQVGNGSPLSLACLAKDPRKNTPTYMDYDQYMDSLTEDLPDAAQPTRYYYLESPLSQGQWQLLLDLVRFSAFISEGETVHLLKALSHISGQPSGTCDNLYHFKRHSPNTAQTIATLHKAIQNRQWMSVTYGTHVLRPDALGALRPKLEQRTKNGVIKLGPLALLWANGSYYLVAMYRDNIMHLRVDRILAVTTATPLETFTPPVNFTAAELRDRSPAMYGGDSALVRFRCGQPQLNTVLDYFGSTPQYRKLSDDTLEVSVHCTLSGAKLFALQYMDDITILEPPTLIQAVQDSCKAALARYENP